MEPPTDPIFVFTDDLFVHRSLKEAATYHEFRDTLFAFNQRGQVFELPPVYGAAPILHSEDRGVELVRRLRRKIISLAIYKPDLLKMSKWDAKRAADDEIIRLAVRWFSSQYP